MGIRHHRLALGLVLFAMAFCLAAALPKSRSLPVEQGANPLAGAKTVADVFKEAVPIALESRPEGAVSSITDLAVDGEGRLFVADGMRFPGVFAFTRTGAFIRELSRRGPGPSEYLSPASVEIGRDGTIWIADMMGNRILIFDRDFHFLKSISGQPRFPYYFHLGPGEEIFFYQSRPGPGSMGPSETVFRYDANGRRVAAFAPVPEEIAKIDYWFISDGLDIDRDGFLYEMNPLFYRIRKISRDGVVLAAFGRKTDLFRLVSEKGRRPMMVRGPFCLDRGYVVAQVAGHLEIYDLAGRFLAGGIPFPWKILEAQGDSLYALADEEGSEEGGWTILVFTLR